MKPGSRKSDDADLKRLESLYEQAASAEPNARLDRAVLERAGRTAPRSGWIGPWAYGLAGALCLVLVIGVGLRQGMDFSEAPVEVHEEPVIESERAESAPAFAPQSGSPVSEAASETLQSAPAPRRAAAERERVESESLAADSAGHVGVPDNASGDLFDPVRKLLDEGREAEARETLMVLQEIHPYADIPADLEERLGETARARPGEEP